MELTEFSLTNLLFLDFRQLPGAWVATLHGGHPRDMLLKMKMSHTEYTPQQHTKDYIRILILAVYNNTLDLDSTEIKYGSINKYIVIILCTRI